MGLKNSQRLLVKYCGASSAYFLRTLAPLDINIEIHLFNQGTIGGRLATIQMPYSDQKRMFEAGGSVLHPANLYFKNWMEKFGNNGIVEAPRKIDKTVEEYLAESGCHDPFILEFTNAALNCNYGQSVKKIRVFVGFIELTGSVSGLYSVSGSNKLIVEKLMDFSKVKLISAEAAAISKRNDQFVLYGNDSQEICANYNYIIFAVPLHQNNVFEETTFKKQKLEIYFCKGLYVQNTGYCLRMNDMLTAVVVCSNRQIPPIDDYEGNESSPKTGSNKIWKLFSSFISGLSRMQEIFRIAKNICFVNAVERLASTVGMNAIGNHNCIDMLLRDFGLIDVNKTTKMEL
ncbi:unnamed protein product [Brugia pahangi]|uniref:Prenylcys_lyase domain-containing protein n=1 Tax=Brugia pahangi TaxID=6280 RepID=A0A0N4SXA6_BRUPA|nr:unnamed protein product [Brugia pahangi]